MGETKVFCWGFRRESCIVCVGTNCRRSWGKGNQKCSLGTGEPLKCLAGECHEEARL